MGWRKEAGVAERGGIDGVVETSEEGEMSGGRLWVRVEFGVQIWRGPARASGWADGSSENRWELGSARVPTFCVEHEPLGRASGDGDLPVADGEGGGEPKRESTSASSSSSWCGWMASDGMVDAI